MLYSFACPVVTSPTKQKEEAGGITAMHMHLDLLKTDLNSQSLFVREDNAIFRLGFLLAVTG